MWVDGCKPFAVSGSNPGDRAQCHHSLLWGKRFGETHQCNQSVRDLRENQSISDRIGVGCQPQGLLFILSRKHSNRNPFNFRTSKLSSTIKISEM